MPSVFLVGFMGSGKSTIAQQLADDLGVACVDLDREVELRRGLGIAEIFARDGEASFRAAEREALAWAVTLPSSVVAVGGGAFCDERNRRLIHSSGGVSVFLELPWEVIRRRLVGATADRPKFGDEPTARRLYEERMPSYREARLVLPLVGDELPAEVAATIRQRLEEAACAT